MEVLRGAGREEPFGELSARICSPTLTRHSYVMRAQRGNVHLPGDLGTALRQSKGLELGHSSVIRSETRFWEIIWTASKACVR